MSTPVDDHTSVEIKPVSHERLSDDATVSARDLQAMFPDVFDDASATVTPMAPAASASASVETATDLAQPQTIRAQPVDRVPIPTVAEIERDLAAARATGYRRSLVATGPTNDTRHQRRTSGERLAMAARYAVLVGVSGIAVLAVWGAVSATISVARSNPVFLFGLVIGAVIGLRLIKRLCRSGTVTIYAPSPSRPQFISRRARQDHPPVDVTRRWVEAMESGQWRQSRSTYGDGRSRRHCAIGLLYRVAHDGEWDLFDHGRLVDLGYDPRFLERVENMNQRGSSFKTIARYVRSQQSH